MIPEPAEPDEMATDEVMATQWAMYRRSSGRGSETARASFRDGWLAGQSSGRAAELRARAADLEAIGLANGEVVAVWLREQADRAEEGFWS